MDEIAVSKPSSTDENWWEYRIVFVKAPIVNWQQVHYKFIKDRLIPLIDRISVRNFHILNYYDAEDYIRFRVEANHSLQEKIRIEMDEFKKTGIIIDFEINSYSPRQDAERRFESVRKLLNTPQGAKYNKNWKITGIENERPVVEQSDINAYDKKLVAYENYLARILGKWTKLFFEEIEIKPDDLWLVSVFVHLIINSLVYSGPGFNTEEHRIRNIPPYG